MINKAKRDRLIFALVAAVALVAALATAAVVIKLVLDQNYTPMWFVLGVSVICFYIATFLGFVALDRGTAIKILGVVESNGSTDAQLVADKMGWKLRAAEKMLASCKKWGYI